MHARQRQLCESFGGMSIKSSCGGRPSAFMNSSIFSCKRNDGRYYKRADKIFQTWRIKSKAHCATITLPFEFAKIVERISRRGTVVEFEPRNRYAGARC